jgi:hypothetical protein
MRFAPKYPLTPRSFPVGTEPSTLRNGVRPALAPVQDPQDFNDIPALPINRNVRRSADDQFARSCPPSGTPDLRELQQAGDGGQDTRNLPVGRRRTVVGDMGPCRCQIAQCGFSPGYPHSGMGSSSGRPHDSTHAATSSCAAIRPASAALIASSIAASCHSCTATKSRTACSITHDLGRSRAVAIAVIRSLSAGSSRTLRGAVLLIAGSALLVLTTLHYIAYNVELVRGITLRRS